MEGNLVEIMSSIQGEGLYVGCRQIFLRFSGCNLACPYCDTATSFVQAKECKMEKTPGKRDFVFKPNPMSPENVADLLDIYNLSKHHSISFTGGEPLLHVQFIRALVPLLNGKGPQMFLETNGTLPEKLKTIVDLFDIISMDIKLLENTPWQDHAEFLRIASAKRAYVKLVVLAETRDEDLIRAVELVAAVDKTTPLILQPVTPCGGVLKGPEPNRMIEVQDLAFDYLTDVRVIPQTHKIMGQL